MARSDPARAPSTVRGRQPTVAREGRLETPRAAGVAGLAFAGLFIGSILLLRDQPSGASTAAEIRRFYLGEQALLEGKADAAQSLFDETRTTCPKELDEHRGAVAELPRIARSSMLTDRSDSAGSMSATSR